MYVIDVMANQSESSVEECVSIDESEAAPTPEPGKYNTVRLY